MAISIGTDGDALVPYTQDLVKVIANYKTAASSVKSLLPKAKSSAKPKAGKKAAAKAKADKSFGIYFTMCAG